MMQYTMLLMAPTIVTLLTGLGGRTRPMFNITISNVPGPEKPLFFRGAELLAIYPASIVTHGQALNITCQSYAGTMDFGFTGCHTSVPHLQRLAVYAADAVQELEEALLPKPRRARASAQAAPGRRTKGAAPPTRPRTSAKSIRRRSAQPG
jgi:diacylglycerol O-acyltransferase / wax synthase